MSVCEGGPAYGRFFYSNLKFKKGNCLYIHTVYRMCLDRSDKKVHEPMSVKLHAAPCQRLAQRSLNSFSAPFAINTLI